MFHTHCDIKATSDQILHIFNSLSCIESKVKKENSARIEKKREGSLEIDFCNTGERELLQIWQI